jgi:hypothetical protein
MTTKGLNLALARAYTAEKEAAGLKLALEWLLSVERLKHASMCPANQCTCDLEETRKHAVDNAVYVLLVLNGKAMRDDGRM